MLSQCTVLGLTIQIEARILIFPGMDFHFPSTSVPPGTFFRLWGSEVWVYRGSRVRSPPVPVVLFVYQRVSLLDGLAMYLSCDTMKFHDNESTFILHNFWTSTHGGKLPPWRRHWLIASLIVELPWLVLNDAAFVGSGVNAGASIPP